MHQALKSVAAFAIAAGVTGAAGSALAATVEVRITNLTRGQVFSPPVVWSHNRGFGNFFAFGGEASEEVRIVAEDGDPGPLADSLEPLPTVRDVQIADGPVGPGETVTLSLEVSRRGHFVSLASMLVNTNDTFFALRNERVPRKRTEFFQPGLDAGTEANTEDCSDIPGPACTDIDPGNARQTDGAEGFIFTQEGIHGPIDGPETSDLFPGEADWRNPVAYIVLTPSR